MAERGDGRARRRRTSTDVQWTKVHGRHLSIPIEWLDKRRHDHVALGRGYRWRGATSNGNNCSGCDYCLQRKVDFCEVSRRARRLTLMREEEKEDKIEVAEGLSNGRVPRCAITAFT